MSVKKGMVSRFVCGCSLRYGSLAVGVYGLVFGLIITAIGMHFGITGAQKIGVITGWFVACVDAGSAALSAILIFAVYRRRLRWINFYLILMPIVLVLHVTGVIVASLIAVPFPYFLIPVLSVVVSLALWCYFLIVVGSYVSSIEEDPLTVRIESSGLVAAGLYADVV